MSKPDIDEKFTFIFSKIWCRFLIKKGLLIYDVLIQIYFMKLSFDFYLGLTHNIVLCLTTKNQKYQKINSRIICVINNDSLKSTILHISIYLILYKGQQPFLCITWTQVIQGNVVHGISIYNSLFKSFETLHV